MTKKFDLKPTIVLSAICVVMVALLAVVNLFTAPVIEAQKNAAANEALLVVLPEGKNFEEIDLSDKGLPENIDLAYKEAGGGYVFRVVVTGKNPGLTIMFGIDSSGAIVGTKVIADQETDTYDATVFPKVEGTEGGYKCMTLEGFEPVLVSGATLTSKAYGEAAKLALGAFTTLTGGEVDFRTPEQILQDNCNEALGTEGKNFTEWFRVEVLTGVDKVYTVDGAYVLLIGETFVGYDKDGNLKSEGVDATILETANTAYALIAQSTLTQITELPENMPKRFVEAYRTASGNYVITTKGAGYGINGEWHASGEYITVRVALTADGSIIATETVSQKETDNIGGAALKNPDFVDAFIGKDAEGANGVDTVTGATLTTQGYKSAIKTAFEALELLKGGNA